MTTVPNNLCLATALLAISGFLLSPVLQASDRPSTCTAPPSGLVGWWPGDGNGNDIVGGNNGTLLDGATFAAGEVGQAFSVDGTSYIDASDSNLPVGDSTATISAWINNTQGGNERWIMSWGSRDTCYEGHEIALGIISDHLVLESCGGHVQGTTVVDDGAWHHAAAVWYGSNVVTLYVDGVAQTDISTFPLPPINIVSSGHMLIGALVQYPPDQFIGLVDELQIFNRPLSADEIAAIYNAGSAGLCKPCIADTWASNAPALVAVAEAGGAVVKGRFYVMDGSGGGGRPAPQVYDPATDRWSNRAADPIMRANTAVGVINNQIYVAEGWINADANNPTNALEVFNPARNSWTTKTSSSVARGATASAVINGKLYVTGGNNGGTAIFKTLEIYNPVTDTWSVGAPMPVATGGTGTALKGKFYIVGGTFHGADTGMLLIYNPANNTWRRGTPMPTARSGVSVVAVNGKLYAIGGNINGTNVSLVEVYDPVANTWTTGTPEPTARYGAAAGVIGSKIYITGGFDASGVINGSLDVYMADCP